MRWHLGLLIVAVLPGSALAENEFRDCEMGSDWRRRVAACTYVLENTSTAPDQAKAYENRAAAHNRGNYMHDAVADITRAIELEPNTRRIRERGWYVYKTEDYKKALTDLDTAVAADPADLFIRGVRVDTLLKLKDTGRALVALDEWISRAPDDLEARAKRAKLNIELKNWEQAVPDLDKVIALKPDMLSFLQRAEVNFKIGAKDKALADITRYIELDPDEWGGYFNRGLMYENLGNMSAAIADYDALLRLRPDDSWALDRRKRLIAKYGRTDAPSSPAKATETKTAAPPASASPPTKETEADEPRECRSFVPAVNVIVPVPCMD
jgi:tetratricopeptide (TPR) repeat protein